MTSDGILIIIVEFLLPLLISLKIKATFSYNILDTKLYLAILRVAGNERCTFVYVIAGELKMTIQWSYLEAGL